MCVRTITVVRAGFSGFAPSRLMHGFYGETVGDVHSKVPEALHIVVSAGPVAVKPGRTRRLGAGSEAAASQAAGLTDRLPFP